MTTDLTFITNENNRSLKDRFNVLIKDARFFDALVGYFYTSGFYGIYKSLENTEKIRILVGISTDRRTIDLFTTAKKETQTEFADPSQKEAKDIFVGMVAKELEESQDSHDVEQGIVKFIDWIKCKKLEIRVYPSQNIHAKLYVMTFKEGDRALKGDRSLSLRTSNPKGKYYKKLDGRNIGKYSIQWDSVYLDWQLKRIHSGKTKDIYLTKEKLFFRRVSADLIFTYDDKQYFALNTLVVVNLKKGATVSLKCLLALLNSKLMNRIYKRKFKSTKTVFSEIQAKTVGQLPIPSIPAEKEKSMTNLVERVLAAKRTNPQADTSKLESEIDLLVYRLYGLTDEEIKIVEGKECV